MRIFRFTERDEDFIKIPLPRSLKGKYIEISINEKAPEEGAVMLPSENQMLKEKEDELILLDKLRNQLEVWDI